MMDFMEKKSSPGELSGNKRCCTDCKTTKTPLWRGGPAGPKSLCNACGIRYRKKRASVVGLKKGQERKREEGRNRSGSSSPSSSRRSTTTAGSGKAVGIGGSDLRMKLMALGEEEQAAFCLMALSCGFIFASRVTNQT